MNDQLAVDEAPARPAQVQEPIGVQVGIQGRLVVVLIGGHGISLAPERALNLANMIRNYANQVLHAEHESLARERKVARKKGK